MAAAATSSSSSSSGGRAGAGLGGEGRRDTFSGREKQKDVRMMNIIAARAVADLVRTSLGPKGMDKMIIQSNGEVVITNDGATILKKLDVIHPAAKMLVDLSKAQDVEAGDGTTSVVVIAGGILQAAQLLLDKGIHASTISDAFLLAAKLGDEMLRGLAHAADLSNRESLISSAITSLNSKVVSSHSEVLAPLAVDAVLRVIDVKTATNVDLNNIKIVKRLGGTIEETEVVDGLIFDSGASHTAGGPTSIRGAKIGLIQYCLSPPKTNMENSVVVEDFTQVDRVLKEERKYILGLVKPIFKSGCNVLLIQKSILRDAVNEYSLNYLAKKGVMVIKDIERTDIEFIANTLGCTPVADPEGFLPSKLGVAASAVEVATAAGAVVKVTGLASAAKTVSILVRGSNRLVLDEADRSLHDALCVVRSLVKQRYMVVGGGAPEIELSLRLTQAAEKMGGIAGYCVREYARALEVIPYTLAENAGLHPIAIVTELRKQHVEGKVHAGINVKLGRVTDMAEERVVQPLLVSQSALNLATECVRMLLKIDDIVGVR